MQHLPPDYKEQTFINLSRLDLPDLPDNLFDETWAVTKLDLSFNQLTQLPSSIEKLQNLRELWVNNNNLISLPTNLGLLPLLTRLEVNHNILVELCEFGPNGFFNILNASDNKLTSIPDSIGNLINLSILNLKSNNLTELPETIKNLKGLQVADFTANNFDNREIIVNLRSNYPYINEYWF
jgi:Leucine-rich repeat (LRR) protein